MRPSGQAVPATMRAVRLDGYDGGPGSMAVTEMPVPRPGPRHVLVRIAAAPVNPSDLMFIRGRYGFTKPLPAVPGFEGSGTVVQAGQGLLPRLLLGRRVACAAADPDIAGGTWAEYLVTRATHCIPLRRHVDIEQAAAMFINPLTAWALLEQARRGRHRTLVQTAAAGAVGRMVIRLAKRFSLATINVVRRPEQVELLRGLGAEHVLDSNEPGFDERLRELCRRLGATIGFDAVAGRLSERIAAAQPPGSRLLVYGALSLLPSRLDPESLIFENKRVEGFWLTTWLRGKGAAGRIRIALKVQDLLAADLRTEIQARLPLEEVSRGVELYASHMTSGKVLFIPGRDGAAAATRAA